MIKLAIQITDCGMAAHVGGPPQVKTHIIEIEHKQLEELLKEESWTAKTISIVAQEPKPPDKFIEGD